MDTLVAAIWRGRRYASTTQPSETHPLTAFLLTHLNLHDANRAAWRCVWREVSRDHVLAYFEELVSQNQIQPAVELLVAAEPEDQVILMEQTNPLLLERLFQALPADERAEVMD